MPAPCCYIEEVEAESGVSFYERNRVSIYPNRMGDLARGNTLNNNVLFVYTAELTPAPRLSQTQFRLWIPL